MEMYRGGDVCKPNLVSALQDVLTNVLKGQLTIVVEVSRELMEVTFDGHQLHHEKETVRD